MNEDMGPVPMDGGYNRRTFSGGTPLSSGEQLITSVHTILPRYVPSNRINPAISEQAGISKQVPNMHVPNSFYLNQNQNREKASEQASSKEQEASSKDGSFNQSKVIELLALFQGQSEGE